MGFVFWLSESYQIMKRRKSLQKGGVGSYIFYGVTLLILLSLPATMILVNTNTNQVSRASQDTVMFSSPPSIAVTTSADVVARGQSVSIHLDAPNSNWYVIYFTQSYPIASQNIGDVIEGKKEMTGEVRVVYKGSALKDFQYTPSVSGYIVASSYQLQGIFGDFNSGDTVCLWDGMLYMFKRKDTNPITSLIAQKNRDGEWTKLTTCQNTGPSKVEIKTY